VTTATSNVPAISFSFLIAKGEEGGDREKEMIIEMGDGRGREGGKRRRRKKKERKKRK